MAPAAAPGSVNYNTLPYSNNGWGEAHHSSTLAEGVRRGYGLAQLGNAQRVLADGVAATYWQQAQHEALADWLTWVDRNTQIQQQRVAAENDELNRRRANAAGIAELAAKCSPQRLNVTQLGTDGRIEWPDVLLADNYSQVRQSLDQLFHDRADGATNQREIRKAIESQATKMQAQLKARIGQYPATDYIAAKNFVQGLRVEGQCGNAVTLTSTDRAY
jgi:hypothetical protein